MMIERPGDIAPAGEVHAADGGPQPDGVPDESLLSAPLTPSGATSESTDASALAELAAGTPDAAAPPSTMMPVATRLPAPGTPVDGDPTGAFAPGGDAGRLSAEEAGLATGAASAEAPSGPAADGHARAEAPAAVSLGARLSAARVALGLSPSDVAGQLKVPVRKIAAFENDRWDEMPQHPYFRGFVRNYAKVLAIDADVLVHEVEERVTRHAVPADLGPAPSLRTPFPQRRAMTSDSSVGRLLVWAAVLLVPVAGFIYWSGTPAFQKVETFVATFGNRPAGTSGTSGTTTTTTPASELADAGTPKDGSSVSEAVVPHLQDGSGGVPGGMAATLGASGLADAPQSAPPQNPGSVTALLPHARLEAPAAPLAAATPLSGQGTLLINFRDDSWVEVRQADGKVLLSQLNHSGAQKVIEAAPPLELVIGNAPGVDVEYHGANVDLVPYTRERVAHITLQ